MLRTRVISSVFVVLVGVVPALFGPWGVAAAFAVLGLLSLHELTAMLAHVEQQVLWPISAAVIVLGLVAAAADWPTWVFTGLVALSVFLPGGVLIFRRSLDGALAAWMGTLFSTLWLMLPLVHIVRVRAIAGPTVGSGAWLTHLEASLGVGETARGMAWFLVAVITVWFTDVGAYAAGRAFGTHKMIPAVSPNKTWEGFAGGIVMGGIAAVVANFAFGLGMVLPLAFAVGVVLAAVATVGDLAESLVKRQTGVKDTGALIPGHGGVIDRLDSQFYVFVVVYYIALVIQ